MTKPLDPPPPPSGKTSADEVHISVSGHYHPPPNPYLLGRGGGRFQHVSLINWHVYTYCIEVAKNEEERKGKRRERRGEERRRDR